MSYYILDAGDKSTDKIFLGFEDGSYKVKYVKRKKVWDEIQEAIKENPIYLYAQERPFGKMLKYEPINRIDNYITKLEIDAEPYLNRLASNCTGKGIKLGTRLKDCKNSYDLILEFRRWQGWRAESGRTIKEYYKRRENEG